jgi:ribosomal protein L37AE/L43A
VSIGMHATEHGGSSGRKSRHSMMDETLKAVRGRVRTCPVCATGELVRTKRKPWMNRVPASKHYSCARCKAGFLRLFDTFQFRVADRMGSISGRNHRKRIVLVCSAMIGLVYLCYRIVMCLYEVAQQ